MFDQGFVFSCFKWILTAGSIVGVVLNVRGDRNGFLIWIFTNTAWVIIDLAMGIPEQAALFAVYSGLAVWGYIKWGELKKIEVKMEAVLSRPNSFKKLDLMRRQIAEAFGVPYWMIWDRGEQKTCSQAVYSMECQEPMLGRE